ncbi:MAG: CocE/NonD family hydrolase [Chloroflexi bacterium]|nr:CocE/NonD family hydrolase [Chloroflexota bacterium]
MATQYSIKVDFNVPVTMRDGVTLYADVFRPDAAGQFPGLITRTPYDKGAQANRVGTLDAIRAATNGFATVVQDVRGRFASEGDFYTFVNEINDGYDSIEWLADQPWCTGKVGTYGISYVGATQWLAAKSNPPSLTAMAPGFTASDYHEGWAWQGGAFELGFNLSWAIGALSSANWAKLSKDIGKNPSDLEALITAKDSLAGGFSHLPVKDMPHLKDGIAPYYYDWLAHPEYDDYWKALCIEESHSDITVPALNVGGWYDIFMGGSIRNFTQMRKNGATEQARNGQRLVIGPWIHNGTPLNVSGNVNFGTRSSSLAVDLQGMYLRYYDHWLKGEDNGVADEKPVRIFVMGDNQWRFEDEWPLRRADETRFYLHSKGRANSLNGDGSLSQEMPGNEPPDIYHYNPLYPVPTSGGGLCCDPGFMAPGAFDQRPIEERQDVLVYSTPPLERDVEVTGPVSVTLFATSSALDTDFTAKLVDVEPNGYARNLTDGIVRARYRHPRQPAAFLTPGEVYEFRIDLWATSNVFKKGHRIRLDVSSSNFPRFDRNLNTGGPIGGETDFVSALQNVLHSGEHASYVTLPVVPRE